MKIAAVAAIAAGLMAAAAPSGHANPAAAPSAQIVAVAPTPKPGSGNRATPSPAAASGAAPASTPPSVPAPTPRVSRIAPVAPAERSTTSPAATPAPYVVAMDALKAPAPEPRPMTAAATTTFSIHAETARRLEEPGATPAVRGAGLCNDPRLGGEELAVVDGRGDCGVRNPIRLSSVSGVRLTRPVTVGCEVSRRLADWVDGVAKPAAAAKGAALASMDPYAGYTCRPVNGQVGRRLSEHAFGHAIDLGVFRLSDGREISVLDGWRSRGEERRFLQALWTGACDTFGTVLGPDSDRWHANHFHFDVAQRRQAHCR